MKKYIPHLLGLGTIASGWILVGSFYMGQPKAETPSNERVPFNSYFIEKNLQVDEQAVKIDPYSAMGWSMLASSNLSKSRETDDGAAAVRAERAARKSLSIRKLGNIGSWNKLISSLLQQHRFADALAECVKAEKEGIYSDDTILQHADCLIEIGQYDEAGTLVSKNPRAFGKASGWAVRARLLDIAGKPQQAVDLLDRATNQIEANSGASGDTVAWFHTRLGQECLRAGKHGAAQYEFESALRLYPRDYKAMTGLARLASMESQWQQAVEWGLKADAIAQMADTRALVGDAYAMMGDSANAELMYANVAALVGRPSGITDGLHEVAPMAGTHAHRLDRQYANFCADHLRDSDGAYAAALRDLDVRKDIYAFDALAWVCLARGQKLEALRAIDRALERHSEDPMLLYHAGVIYAANGDKTKAGALLKGALAIDLRFDGIAAPKAQRLLNDLSPAATPTNVSLLNSRTGR